MANSPSLPTPAASQIPRLQNEYSLNRPPPLWHHLGQPRQQQIAQLLADLIRRMRLPASNPEGSQHEL